ncbi:SGNH/GDSL hydrolase family protein [Microbacterium halotolerans]|uniref:SGNH/GDSL hydrolase family protein n=1 Tax=Microbacterium halotolerans TaxID=246613 RepID=UPI0013C345ED|nr:SGNH/GDSL hydrolase family protein [Microbacterium halotolerans]
MRLRVPVRRLVLAAAALCAVAAIAVTALVLRPAPSEPVAQAEGPYSAGSGDGAHVLVFGDSWTYGQAATERVHGYAYRLAAIGGWRVTVAGEPASGYLRAGVWGRTYRERIDLLDPALDPDLVVVQGSINDRRLGADGYRGAVVEAWDALADRFPDAQMLVLGPAPQVLPVEKATARIDRDLAELAEVRGWPYVSPIADEWITPDNYLDVIDTSEQGSDHPSDAGHRFLAEQVAAAVRPLLAPATVEAVTEQPSPTIGG